MSTITTNGIEMLQAEKVQALTFINVSSFAGFVYLNANTVVGKDKLNNPTTLEMEVSEVAKLSHRAYIEDGVNYYHSHQAFAIAGLSDEDLKKSSDRKYNAAAKKLLFLNSVAKRIYGKGFIQVKINLSDINNTRALVDSFEWIVAHYQVIDEI